MNDCLVKVFVKNDIVNVVVLMMKVVGGILFIYSVNLIDLNKENIINDEHYIEVILEVYVS